MVRERKLRESNPQNPGQRFIEYKSSGLADAQSFRVGYKLQYHVVAVRRKCP